MTNKWAGSAYTSSNFQESVARHAYRPHSCEVGREDGRAACRRVNGGAGRTDEQKSAQHRPHLHDDNAVHCVRRMNGGMDWEDVRLDRW